MNINDKTFKYKPPLIIHGPWGTGKTETILQTICYLLREHLKIQLQAESENISRDLLPPQRILLATLTNSAADLCISKTLDKFVTNNPRVKLLRIMVPHRRINTIPQQVLKYCKSSEHLLAGQERSPLLPTIEEILNATLVLVTENCAIAALLRNKDLYGKFTHIFIDEAAQSFEPSALGPLVLADPKTVVLLAGYEYISSILY